MTDWGALFIGLGLALGGYWLGMGIDGFGDSLQRGLEALARKEDVE